MTENLYEGEGNPCVGYPLTDSVLVFQRRCPNCARFVKSDKFITYNSFYEEYSDVPNATCSRCGRVKMPCLGYFSDREVDYKGPA